MVHWARFPAFRHIKNKLKMPHLTTDSDCGAVFMRWKERFLVPDHRVQDINGASFAGQWMYSEGLDFCSLLSTFDPPGFYYICVDFNSQPLVPSSMRQSSVHRPSGPESTGAEVASPKPEASRRSRNDILHDESRSHHPSVGARSGPQAATMTGFYFHQNSEP